MKLFLFDRAVTGRSRHSVHNSGQKPHTPLLTLLIISLAWGHPIICPNSRCFAEPRQEIETPAFEELSLRYDPSKLLHAASEKYTTARYHEDAHSQQCVDNYFLAACLSWHGGMSLGKESDAYYQAMALYSRSVSRLIVVAQQYKRLDPRSQLLINSPSGMLIIPVTHSGFPWQPQDFSRIEPVRSYDPGELNHVYRCCGIGVPSIAFFKKSCTSDARTAFVADNRPFSATVLITSNLDRVFSCFSPNGVDITQAKHMSPVASLQMVNPLRVDRVNFGKTNVSIARDLSAPIAYAAKDEPRQYLQGFLQPGSTTGGSRLLMIEPFQPGKIPLVFVHGLLSDRMTWANLANEIRARYDLSERYQLWAFQYPTGQAFLRSAAQMRSQLWAAYQRFAPIADHASISQTVLVGHSMGGLLSKLQISYSGNQLWDSVSRRPFNEVRMSPDDRTRLSQTFFFEPLPFVRRVVFIGTPHDGSSFARRPIGQLGSLLVKTPREDQREHRALLLANPLNFNYFVRRRLPTSVDLLKPGNPILTTMRGLPVDQQVHLHSVIGTGKRMVFGGPADGVVPITSARHQGVEDELYVDARHEDLHSHAATISYISDILSRHTQTQEVMAPSYSGHIVPVVEEIR